MTAKYVGVKSIAKNAIGRTKGGRNTKLLSAARLFTLIMRGCYIIVLARYLGPELYGIFSYGQALYLVLLLSAARLFTLITRGCYIIVLARYLGPELYGIFSYGQALYLVFLFVASLGIGEILSRKSAGTAKTPLHCSTALCWFAFCQSLFPRRYSSSPAGCLRATREL